jgi:hypothetical protein
MLTRQKTLEDEICERYEVCRRRIHPHYSAGNRHDEDWAKAASLIRSIGANPRAFVEAQFEIGGATGHQSFPWPSQLHGNRAIDLYNRYIESFRSRPEEIDRCQLRYLNNFVTKRTMSIDEALLRKEHPFRPYFRLLCCSEAIFPDLQRIWGDLAERELREEPDLYQYIEKKYGSNRPQSIVRRFIPGETGGPYPEVPPPSEIPRDFQSYARGF